MNKFSLFVLSFFNAGYVKYAPGTFASLLACVIWYFIPNSNTIQFSILILTFFIGMYLCYFYNKNISKEDSSFIVIDEVLGMFISLFMIPKNIFIFFISLCVFRFLDIFKPFFIQRIEKIQYGFGIMLDDILAGIYTIIFIKLLIPQLIQL